MSSALVESLCLESRLLAVGGLAGTGKGKLCDGLVKHYNIPYTCGGDVFRKVARKSQVSGVDFEHIARRTRSADEEVDGELLTTGQHYIRHSGGIIEARRVLKLFPHSTSILLVCDDAKRFERIFARKRENYPSLEAAREETLSRERAVDERYTNMDGETLQSLFDPVLWQIVIPNTNLTEEQVLRMAIAGIEASPTWSR